MDNEALLRRFEAEYLDRHGISAQRRRTMLKQLRGLAEQMPGASLLSITPSDMMAWQGAQLKRGLMPTTVRQREGMLRAFFGWTEAAGLLPLEAAARLKAVSRVPEPHQYPKPYRRHEILEFREALSARLQLLPRNSRCFRRYARGVAGRDARGELGKHGRRLLIEAQVSLALEEGLRLSEIHNITLTQVAPDNEAVIVPCAKRKTGYERLREVPYTAHSRLCVEDYLRFRAMLAPAHQHPWLRLLPTDLTKPQSFYQLERSLQLIEGNWTWHRFRHTFATERLRAGMPLEKLQLMMGHADLKRTLGYAEIVNADVRAEADRTEDAFARLIGVGT